jgi:hypothetical protein
MAKRGKMVMITTGASAIALAGVVGLTSVSAATMTSSVRHGAGRQQTYEQRLDTAVTEGKLTSAQEQAILAEEQKLRGELKAAGTPAQRKAARKAVRAEASAWAKSNNVSGRWLLAPRHLRG